MPQNKCKNFILQNTYFRAVFKWYKNKNTHKYYTIILPAQSAFIFIDIIYAILILSIAFISIAQIQSIIAHKNTPKLREFESNNINLLHDILNNQKNDIKIKTSHKTYNASLFSVNNNISLRLIVPRF